MCIRDRLKGVRTIRSKLDIAPKILLPIAFEKDCDLFEEFKDFYLNMVKIQHRKDMDSSGFKFLRCIEGSISYSLGVPLEAAEERLARFKSDLEKLIAEKMVIDERLNKPGFQDRAPTHVVEKDKNRSHELTQQVLVLQDSINQLT